MDLACKENLSDSCKAIKDRGIFNDHRVIDKMLREEVVSIPSCDYFQVVQNDIQPFMRKVVTTWMLEVCEEQMCEDQILPLAVNLMDRFLCVCVIKRNQLQLLGATCLLISSKIRSTTLLTVDLLCAYTDHSVSHDLMVSFELLVLSKLQWNISAITGFDYIDHVIERFTWGNENPLLRRHAHTLVSICYTEPSLLQTLPSVIAAACIGSAVRGLKLSSTEMAFSDVCTMLNVSSDTMEYLISIIDNAVAKVASTNAPSQEKSSELKTVTQGYESPPYGKPETPTEVDNVYF